MIREVAGAVFAMAAAGGCGYYVLCVVAIRDFVREKSRVSESAPPVSILKPLKGMDPELYESFRSHCLIDYPEYEIVFGVSDLQDAAVPWVQRLMAEFPDCEIKLVECPEATAVNRKVGNLAQML